ncbi:putative Long-chain-fatty-acid--luciferin-component ligase [Microcystis aeruginosa PCC 9809]|jgi:long-chain-fatty-acid---luciferin-component ligase|uniref:Putative Long-chain-fatty-acid--luciferin-component ligase n=1 Tax=Microcystis aeruginosa PCC 9809 TaxID=1160285 RepID=I4HFX9_MICAE|nr:long-chain-fatty-acid--luciferin-component ligase [Microcystis aeruginosa]CCI20953.1 putative Long-chain-fatty-acid--luciferin-component ligase [Microcystis aeruginosa PCC 9809]
MCTDLQEKDKLIPFQSLNSIDLIDDLIYQCEDFFTWTQDQIQKIQTQLLAEAFSFHYNHSESYHKYCHNWEVTPQDVQEPNDLIKIPLVPSTMFKLRDITSCSPKDIVKVCTSSGTMGSISKIYRDETTLNRFLGSIRSSIDLLLNLDDAFCVNLGPSTEESGDLWFSYAISVVDLIFPSQNFVKDDVFYPDRAYQEIIKQHDKYENLVVIGAPIMFLELISYMEKHSLTVENSEKIYFVTAGGWKRFSGQAISRPVFEEKIGTSFRGSVREHFRDVFNMVELNTVLAECSHQIKHVVPWIKVLILEPRTLRSLPPGELGIIAYLDPSTTSYPGFILSDDFGRIVLEGKCPCGRTGQGIEIVRRIKSVESRGCALKIDKNYASSSTTAVS